MARYFLDSSAVVKRYVAELGSAWVSGLLSPAAAHEPYLVGITGVEVVAALVNHSPSLAAVDLAQALKDFKQDFQNQYHPLAVNSALIALAMDLAGKHRLRGYDAVQLAGGVQLLTASLARADPLPTFVSADGKLNAAATAEGLAVDDPTLHP